MGTNRGKADPVRLSRRELEVARLVAEGLTNREIATRLFLSERTVDGHLEHVREKLGVNTRAQVAAWVVRQGEPKPPEPAAPPSSGQIGRRSAVGRAWPWAAVAAALLIEAAVVLALLPAPPAPMIRTVAGTSPVRATDVGGYSGEGVRATTALLRLPSDLAVSPDGSLYIADYGNTRVRRVAGDGSIVTVAGGGKEPLREGAVATSVDIGYVSNVAVDSLGHLYLLTINKQKILEVWTVQPSTFLTLMVSLGKTSVLGGSEIWPPPVGGIAVSTTGVVYVSDRARNQVFRVFAGEEPRVLAGTGEAGSLGDNGPATGAQLWHPGGLAIDGRSGDLLIADSGNNRIRRVNSLSIIDTVAGSGEYYGDSGDGGAALSARLSFPYGVAVAKDGTIFIADTGNHRVRKVNPSGVITTIAGTGLGGFSGDGGPAGLAQLRAPEGIALDETGDLFIADTLNHRVREVPRFSG
jgi:DNA-binding CsgD family transcriptional regulator/sugar lactone lactonase YvrE